MTDQQPMNDHSHIDRVCSRGQTLCPQLERTHTHTARHIAGRCNPDGHIGAEIISLFVWTVFHFFLAFSESSVIPRPPASVFLCLSLSPLFYVIRGCLKIVFWVFLFYGEIMLIGQWSAKAAHDYTPEVQTQSHERWRRDVFMVLLVKLHRRPALPLIHPCESSTNPLCRSTLRISSYICQLFPSCAALTCPSPCP